MLYFSWLSSNILNVDSYWDWRIKKTKKYRWNNFSQLIKQRSSKIGACLICTFLFGLDLFMTYRWWWSHKCKNLSSLQIKLRGERGDLCTKIENAQKKNRWIITYYPVSKKVIESDQEKNCIEASYKCFYLPKSSRVFHLWDHHQG